MTRGGPPEATPVLHHSGLRQREGEERSDGEERDEAVGDTAERNEQDTGEH